MVAPLKVQAQKILTNISTLGQRTHLKFENCLLYFIVYNITISSPYPVYFFLMQDNEHTINKIIPILMLENSKFVTIHVRICLASLGCSG